MKKAYIIPAVLVWHTLAERVVAASTDVTSNNGITYGGVDEEGEQDPNAKQDHYNVWKDDWRNN